MSEETPTQSQLVRQRLREAIDNGHDLTIKDTKVKICKEIAAELKISYAAVSKHVPKVLKEKSGDTSRSVKKKSGSVDVDIDIPSDVPEMPAPAPAEPAPNQPAPAMVVELPESIAKTIPAEIAAMGGEAVQVYLSYYVLFVQGRAAIAGMKLPVASKKDYQTMAVQWAVCHVRYNWQLPPWLDKVMLLGGTAAMIVLPIAKKYDLVNLLSSSKGKKKSALGGTESDKPLDAEAPAE